MLVIGLMLSFDALPECSVERNICLLDNGESLDTSLTVGSVGIVHITQNPDLPFFLFPRRKDIGEPNPHSSH